MKSMGLQRPTSDDRPRHRHYDRVGANALDDDRQLLEQLIGEQLPRGILLEDVVYYTGLGVLVENNVRGLVREWRLDQ